MIEVDRLVSHDASADFGHQVRGDVAEVRRINELLKCIHPLALVNSSVSLTIIH